MAAGLNVILHQYDTAFYPPSVASRLTGGARDVSSSNVSSSIQQEAGDPKSGALPALWWLGIVIVLVGLRLAYEYA